MITNLKFVEQEIFISTLAPFYLEVLIGFFPRVTSCIHIYFQDNGKKLFSERNVEEIFLMMVEPDLAFIPLEPNLCKIQHGTFFCFEHTLCSLDIYSQLNKC